MEVVSYLAYEFWSCVYISLNQILKNLITWYSDTVIVFWGIFKGLYAVIAQNNQGNWCSDTVIVYSSCLKRPSIIKNHQNLGPLCSDTGIFFLALLNYWGSLSTEIFEINISFEYGLDTDLFWMMSEFLYCRENIDLEFSL